MHIDSPGINSLEENPKKIGDLSSESGKVKKNSSVSVEEYQKIVVDWTSSKEEIQKRIDYLDAFCRNIIRNEIESHAQKQRRK